MPLALKSGFGVIALCLGLAIPATAQDYASLLDTSSDLRGRLHAITAVPGQDGITPITIRVPLAREEGPSFGVLIDEPPSDGGMVTFTFHTPQNALIEAVNLSTAVIPLEEERQRRLEIFGALMRQTALPAIKAALPGATSDGLRPIEVAGLPAIEMLGNADHPEHGPIRWRLVGIPNPEAAESIYAFVQVATDQLPLPASDDFARSLSGRLLTSLQFN
jgi:hypothetical protein